MHGTVVLEEALVRLRGRAVSVRGGTITKHVSSLPSLPAAQTNAFMYAHIHLSQPLEVDHVLCAMGSCSSEKLM